MDIVFLILGIGLLICLCFLFGHSKQKKLSQVWENTSKMDSIFVIVPRFLNVEIIDRIFTTANHPQRIFIGLGSRCLPQPNVRCLKLMQPFGNSIARQQILKDLFLNETYILSVNECSLFTRKGWDDLLIKNLKQNHVLSYWPLRSPDDNLHGKTTFPVFKDFLNNYPRFEPRVSTSRLEKPFEIGVATFDCLFGTSEVIKPLIEYGLPYIGALEENLLLTFHLFNENIKVLTPESDILIKGKKIDNEIRGKDFKELRKLTFSVVNHLLYKKPITTTKIPLYIESKNYKKTSDEFFTWLGVDVSEKTAAGKSRFGLFGAYSDANILSRFETLSLFYDQKNQFFY